MGLTPYTSNIYRRADAQPDGGKKTSDKLVAGRGSTSTADSEEVRVAKQAITAHTEGIRDLLEIRSNWVTMITEISSLCVQKPTKWRKKVAEIMGKMDLAVQGKQRKAKSIAGGVVTLGLSEVLFQLLRLSEVNKICKDLGNGDKSKYRMVLSDIDNQYKISNEVLNELQADLREIQAIEHQAAMDKAKAASEADLAKTAGQRAAAELEMKRLEQQRRDELAKVKVIQEANLKMEQERSKKVIFLGVGGIVVLGFVGFLFFKK